VGTDLSLMKLVTDASMVVQFVMLILLLISISSWALIFQRRSILKKSRSALEKFNQIYQQGDLNRLYDYLAQKRETLMGMENIIKSGFKEYLKAKKQVHTPAVILQSVERGLRVALNREEQYLSKSLSFLGSVGSISVYIGLFGTVWGIMNAFGALASIQQATLAMVAPGISEALIATALGLFAAIPAVFAYHRFSHAVNDLVQNYDNLSEEFYGLLEQRVFQSKPDEGQL
jgi:biopolymer transport protein TolQ